MRKPPVGTPLNKQILNLIVAAGDAGLAFDQIVEAAGATRYAVGLILGNLARFGHAQKTADGRWELARLKEPT